MQIIIIDDDGEDREFFIQAIKEIFPEASCLEFAGCREALQHLSDAQNNPHYIFLDVHMNLMNGRECLTNLRTIDTMKDTTIVMYTGTGYERERQQYLNLGADHFFVKPRSYSELLVSLKDLLSEQD